MSGDDTKNTQRIVLYGNQNSGHSYKVALMLTLCKLPYQYRHISLDQSVAPSERPRHFRNNSRFGQVPVLIIDDLAISQSNLILSYLGKITQKFSGQTLTEERAIQEWLYWEADRIGRNLSSLRYLFLADIDRPQVKKYLRDRVIADLDVIEHTLGNSDFILGNSPTIADLSICGYLYWAEDAQLNVWDWNRTKAWLDRITSLQGWLEPTLLMANPDN